MKTLRILPRESSDGRDLMAGDEALLEAAASTSMRCYAWSTPTLSLGYFQDHATVVAHVATATEPPPSVVRRITGGGAIWHEHEATYCLVGELGTDGVPLRSADLYQVIHAAVARSLERRGIVLHRQSSTVGDRRYRDEPRCFASPACDDLVRTPAAAVGGLGKVLGSAARTRGQRVLVHGSLKLASNPWDGDAAAGCGLSFADAATLLEQATAEALGLQPQPDVWTAAEQSARERIRAERYATDAWVVERRGPRP